MCSWSAKHAAGLGGPEVGKLGQVTASAMRLNVWPRFVEDQIVVLFVPAVG